MDSKASWLGVNINPWLLCLLLLIVLYVLPWSLKPGSGPGLSLSLTARVAQTSPQHSSQP